MCVRVRVCVCMCVCVRLCVCAPGVREEEGGGLASSAWHIDQMGQPPRLGCLGMCTGQCAVVDVSSKCWRSMLVLDMRLYTR